MPRGVKGSGPQKNEPKVEVVEEDKGLRDMLSDNENIPDHEEDDDDFLNEPTNQQEFNEFIMQLARNAAQQEIASLDERIRDLEGLVAVLIGKTGAVNDDLSAAPYRPAEVGVSDYDIPEYKQEHQGGDGIGWYTG